MNRSPHLSPLSHDHHEGLVVTGRIKSGLKRRIEPAELAWYIRNVCDLHLVPHFRAEEELLIPVLKDSDKSDLIDRLLREHKDIYRLAHLQPADAGWIAEFADKLRAHIRFEERELFRFIEDVADGDTLLRIGERLRDLTENRSHDEILPTWEY